MTSSAKSPPPAKGSSKTNKKDRLAKALRQNLLRRKAAESAQKKS